jgi:hypothetical protein
MNLALAFPMIIVRLSLHYLMLRKLCTDMNSGSLLPRHVERGFQRMSMNCILNDLRYCRCDKSAVAVSALPY